MAESGSTRYTCSYCDVQFPFKSKYMRHLKSEGHQWAVKMAANSTALSEDDSEEEDQPNDTELNFDVSEDSSTNNHPTNQCTETDSNIIDDLIGSDSELFLGVGSDFRPFRSRLEALLFMLINSPQPIGEASLKFMFHIVRLSEPTIPSIDVLKRFTLPGFVPPSKYTVDDTDVYFILPSTVLKQCFGNLITATKIARCPEVASDNLTEMYHAEYWHKHFPTPMVSVNDSHVFVNDFITFNNGSFGYETVGKVLEIYSSGGDVKLKVHTLLSSDQASAVYGHINTLYPDKDTYTLHETIVICLEDVLNVSHPTPKYIQKISNYKFMGLDYQEYCQFIKDHPLKASSAGLPVVICPLVLFSDDTSGNRSKKWNKFDYWSLTFAGLPNSMSRSFENMHFLTCSNHLSSLDIAKPLVEDFKKLENGVVVYDASIKRQVLVIAPVMAILADNARASELVNHLGSRAKKFCRKCMATCDDTETGMLRTKELALEQMRIINEATTDSDRKTKRTKFGMKESENPLFNLSVDLFRCTPVETLHTVLLGACKYMLRTLMGSLSSVHKKEVLARIKSWPYCGFSERITGNIIYHYKSFVGRDFKAWLQMVLFIIPSIVSDQEIACWFALVKLFRHLYCLNLCESVIKEIEQLAHNFVVLITQYSPEYSKRLKIHILLHLAHDLRMFGPQTLFNTERFESFNSLMRNQNVYSNRHSPSKDICYSFAVLEHLRFICSGGRFTDSAAPLVGDDLKTLYESTQVQKFLNFKQSQDLNPTKAMYQPGTLRKLKHNEQATKLRDISCNVCFWKEPKNLQFLLTEQHCTLDYVNELTENTFALQHGAVISNEKELIDVGSFVQLENEMMGILLAVLQTLDPTLSLCLIQSFDEVIGPHEERKLSKFECPLLTLSKNICFVSSLKVRKSVSLAHLCESSCRMTGSDFQHDYSNTNFCFNIFCIGN